MVRCLRPGFFLNGWHWVVISLPNGRVGVQQGYGRGGWAVYKRRKLRPCDPFLEVPYN